MQEQRQDTLSRGLERIEPYSILTDILRNWWVILLGALAAAMIANVVVREQSHAVYSYTTSATFVVSTQGSSSSVYSNLASAQSTANTFSNILNSGIMQDAVCEDLGLTSFDAQVSAQVITETNLLVLTVTADSPRLAYQVIRSIMDNYETITRSVVGSTILEVLEEPEVPVGGSGAADTRGAMIRGFQLGLLAFALLFAYLSYRSDTIKSSSDLNEKLDAAALGTIYHERKYKSLGARLRGKKRSILVTDATTSFGFVESYKKIAAKLSYLRRGEGGQLITVTSLLENEGKSTAAVNLALSLAMNAKRVLLLDCDLRRPSQYLVLEKRKERVRNWTDLLSTDCSVQDVIQYDNDRGIFLLLETREHANSTELLSSKTMEVMLQTLRHYFDYIVLDSPPLSVTSDAEVLADRTDLSVLVVRYHQAQAEDLNDAIDVLSACRAELAGCVLNRARALPGLGAVSYGYGHGYGGYYSYGHYGKSEKRNHE